MRFRITTDSGRVRVIPFDALAPLAAGRLDPRLFEVTTLLEFGYEDGRRSQLPLIVQREEAGNAAAPLRGATTQRDLPAISGVSLLESKKEAQTFWRSLFASSPQPKALAPGIAKVWLNGLRHLKLDHSVPQIGAPTAWAKGLTGKGVKVAVVDSGIDTTHPDLAGKVVAAKVFVNEPAGDKFGHGTHVASTVAGSGAASGGKYRGVAPDAQLLDAKVCDVEG
jgi:subtilisin family serine protease